MIEQFYEQSVVRTESEIPKKKIRVLKILRYVSYFLFFAIAGYYYGIMPIFQVMQDPELHVVVKVLYVIANLLPAVFAVVLCWLTFFLMRKYTEEFDYRLKGDVLRIVRITNRSRRKLVADLPISSFERIGKVGTPSCVQAERQVGKDKKKYYFAVIHDIKKDSDCLYYALLHYNTKSILYFEPDEEMLRTLRLVLRRDIIEKD